MIRRLLIDHDVSRDCVFGKIVAFREPLNLFFSFLLTGGIVLESDVELRRLCGHADGKHQNRKQESFHFLEPPALSVIITRGMKYRLRFMKISSINLLYDYPRTHTNITKNGFLRSFV